MIKANPEEMKREKARQLRYRKPIVKNLNIETIQEEISDIISECYDVSYYFDTDDDTLLNVLDGDEEQEYEMKMMFSDLCAECEQMQQDLWDAYIPNCFNDLFVAAGAANYGGGLLGWDSYEQDYFGIDCMDDFAESESKKRLMRMTKDELIDCMHACLKILYAYLGIRHRYDCLKAALDILRDENTGYLQLVKQIEETYEKAEKDTMGFKYDWGESAKRFDMLISNMPAMAWVQ